MAASYVPHVARVARHLDDGLYAQDVHVHTGWGNFPPIHSPALRTTTKGAERKKNFVVRIRDLPVDADIREHVRECCASPVMDVLGVERLVELMRAIVALHADRDEVDMYGAVCATPWSPFGITIGVNEWKRTVPAPLDPALAALVPMTVRVDLLKNADEWENVLSFQAQAITVSSFDLPTPVEALRILAQRAAEVAA
jgi:hypothetical protein